MTKEVLSPPPEACDIAAHNARIKSMFGSIARGYDFLNHSLSLGLDIHWRRLLVGSLASAPDGLFLDLAAGTFDVSLALAKAYPGRRILGADLCLAMLSQGRHKLEKRAGRITPLNADAFNLPFADNSLAAVAVSFGLRNMLPRQPALAEMLRVLKPGGRLSVLEFGSARSKVWLGLYNFYLARLLPRIGGAVSGDRGAYDYLARSIRDLPPAGELAEEMRAAGFSAVRYRRLSGGIVYLHTADKL